MQWAKKPSQGTVPLRGPISNHVFLHVYNYSVTKNNSLGKLPPINVAAQESLLLGYMPHRDDFEDFDKTVEGLVSQIGDKSVADEDVDVALKLGGLFLL